MTQARGFSILPRRMWSMRASGLMATETGRAFLLFSTDKSTRATFSTGNYDSKLVINRLYLVTSMARAKCFIKAATYM